MKKSVVIIAVILFMAGSAGMVFGEENNSDDSEWKKRIASATYGLNFGFYNLEYRDAEGSKTQNDVLFMPGIDLRHFNGTNVPRSGGFYYGYELGMIINAYLGDHSFKDINENYKVTGIAALSVLAMVKHGYKFYPASGSSPGFGLELGMGLMGGGGNITIIKNDDPDKTNLADVTSNPISPVFELGFEGSIPRDDNSRFVARLSIMGGFPVLETDSYGTMIPVRISLRGGFTMNH